jgi:hypothetical protein
MAGMDDNDLLATIPDFVSFGMLMKATPRDEGGRRIIYVEASKETRDQAGEIVLAKALKDSADVFRKFGVLDLDHKSMPSVAERYGISDPESWIIGQPLDVAFNGGTTIVKAELRRGDTVLAERANRVWEGMTQVSPPDRYYASVGGSVTGREVRVDPLTKSKVPVITGTRWNNLALSLNPVHAGLSPATTAPVGTFTKSLGGWVMNKALEASYATNPADMSGGAALRMQSLDGAPTNYFDLRNKLAAALRNGDIGPNPGAADVVAYCAQTFGLSHADAAENVERFYRDLHTGLKQRSKTQ